MNMRKRLIIAISASVAILSAQSQAEELDGENITAKQAAILLANYYTLDASLTKVGQQIISESINNGLSIEQYIENDCKDKKGTERFECLGASYYGVTKALGKSK